MKTQFFFALYAGLAFFATPFFASAEVKLPSILGNHMVLQQGEPVPVWGWADEGEKVTVSFHGKTVSTQAGKDGKWRIDLPAMKANAKGSDLTVKGSNEIKLKDVLVGEVWLCSGQSNMEWSVARSGNAKEEIANGKHPLIRHVKVPRKLSLTPQEDVPTGGWQVCSPSTVANFTAVGYYFARHLQKEIKAPIGLIGSNWGGTRIEPWTPAEGFKAVPALRKGFADKLDQFTRGKPGRTTPTHMYNAMIAPLLPYAIKGALWYQGESNNGEGMLYHEKMKALIAGWRSVWEKPDLPFYFVQLAPFNYRNRDPKALPWIWQAQLETLKVPHTGMAVTTDITTVNNIHPPNKQDVGKRLALWALAKNYGYDKLVYSGPIFDRADHSEGKDSLAVYFKEFHGRNVGLTVPEGKGIKVTHFEVAGEDGKWHPAEAFIVYGHHVVAKSKEVKKPVHVRFGWDQKASPNLFNRDGLPASPFTTEK